MTASGLTIVPPAGWAVDTVELIEMDNGARLGLAAVPGDSADALASRHEESLAQRLPGYSAEPLTRAGEVLVRAFSWQPDGEPTRAEVAVYADGRVGTLRTEQPPTAQQVTRASELVGRAALAASPPAARDYSIEELAAITELLGATGFPGADHAFADDRERLSARRALVSRGILRLRADGSMELAAEDARWVLCALRPGAVATLDHQGAIGRVRGTIYATGTLTVVHTVPLAGVHRLAPIPTRRLGPMIAELTGLRERPRDGAGNISVPVETYRRLQEAANAGRITETDDEAPDARRLRDLLSAVESSSQLRVAPAADTAVTGGEVVWLDAGEHGLWRIEPSAGRVTLNPSTLDELRAALGAVWAPAPAAGVD